MIPKDLFVKSSIIAENRRKLLEEEQEEMLQQATALSLSQESEEMVKLAMARMICLEFIATVRGEYLFVDC